MMVFSYSLKQCKKLVFQGDSTPQKDMPIIILLEPSHVIELSR